ncbi:MAG: 4Fe-4S dicluster domain-containing protein [Crenarchaeota archaeon]|nr:4Fe-4S dicluster domain-containing protein [Thermoproteota archaeon]MCR8455220.1 4Fe-4S dicluster domain-containing protein [Thermoproteota archaeon]MCR8500869.1 4Fe-4S dicluster domain-containing protein [Thermoproteota archaeon]
MVEQKDSLLHEMLRCSQCNLCISGCPMFIGSTRYDHFSPRSVIILSREALLKNTELPSFLKYLIFICNLCGSCDVRCPAKIKITETIKVLRNQVLAQDASAAVV